MKNKCMLIAVVLLALVALSAQSGLAENESLNMTNLSLGKPSNESDLVAFVESAIAHVMDVGKEKAIKDFNDLNGSWVRGDVYIFAQAFNGTSLVLPFQPDAVGTNRLNLQDAEGRYINREMNCIALHGSGFYSYFYRNPISNDNLTKVSYVSKVDDDWWLGAGIYYNNSAFAKSNATFVYAGSEPNSSLMWKYIQAADAVNENLSMLDQDLEKACEELSMLGIQGPGAQAVLKLLAGSHPSVIDAGIVGTNGTILEVEPEAYQYIKGANVSSEESQKRLLSSKHPLGFQFIRTIEGYNALGDFSPVFDANGTFVGGLSLLINYSRLFEQILSPLQPGGKAKFWVMRAGDGTILYDTDRSQIGLNLSSPIYQQFPEVLDLGNKVRQTRTGYGTYKFLDQAHSRVVKKGVYWTTLANQGEEMRLALTIELE